MRTTGIACEFRASFLHDASTQRPDSNPHNALAHAGIAHPPIINPIIPQIIKYKRTPLLPVLVALPFAPALVVHVFALQTAAAAFPFALPGRVWHERRERRMAGEQR
jgi:hypothetical protein